MASGGGAWPLDEGAWLLEGGRGFWRDGAGLLGWGVASGGRIPRGLTAPPAVFQVCGKSFNRMYNLLGHMHLHAGSKPFKCPYCSSKFNLKGNLSRHMKVKHGVMDIGLDSQGGWATRSGRARSGPLPAHAGAPCPVRGGGGGRLARPETSLGWAQVWRGGPSEGPRGGDAMFMYASKDLSGLT